MYKSRILSLAIIAAIAIVAGPIVVKTLTAPKSGEVLDEALLAGRMADSLPGSDSAYLKDMDHGWDKQRVFVELAKALQMEPRALGRMFSWDAVWKAYNRGRNNWVVWSGGNDRLWDYLANHTYGAFDLLKIISSNPLIQYCGNTEPVADYEGAPQPYTAGEKPAPYPPGYLLYEDDDCEGADRKFYIAGRDNRWKYFGLMNEPCFMSPKGPNPKRFGLWLDVRTYGPDCQDDPFADEKAYPGIKIGARGDGVLPIGSYYGEPTGIVGLRLFPNPDFDEAARANWDPVRYYEDEKYYLDKNLVRPYRVGMACGFCHVGPNPVNPPPDPENPKWEHISSNPGAQYAWIDRVFSWQPKGRHKNFIYQLAHTWLPGTLDTSLVSSDNINNPRTMNAVYSFAARMQMAKTAREELSVGGERLNKQLNDFKQTRILSDFFEPPDTVYTPHVLKDGADSVGVLGALNRVYVNIGLFSEEWLLHFKPLLGGRITPFEIEVAEKNSTFWNANAAQTPDLALFFLASAQPDKLADAPGGDAYLDTDGAKLAQGKQLFAENCAACHSSKQPEDFCAPGETCASGALSWNSPAYKAWMREEVQRPDFLEGNFLSTDRRIPVTILQTNACSPLATNGIKGDIWDNFTSKTYKELPAVGPITVHHPVTGEPTQYEMPGGGRGYTRPASLISLWSSAPYLLNNSVGAFYGEPTVEARMASFNDSIQKMLWPEKRRVDAKLGDAVPGYIQRTTTRSYLKVPAAYLPEPLDDIVGMSVWLPRLFPWAFSETETGLIELGPIPAGTPVNLLANLQPVSRESDLKSRAEHLRKVAKVLKTAIRDFKALPPDVSDEEANRVFANLVDPLMAVNKCPDFVVNRGHYFGAKLADDEKWALIEFLKTF